MSENVDRDLLFGLVAHRLDLIGQRDVVDAVVEWSHSRSRPLGDVLVARGLITAPLRDALDAMVAAHMAQHHGSAACSLAAFGSIDEVRRELLDKITDTIVAESVGRLAAPPTLDAQSFGSRGVRETYEAADDAEARQSRESAMRFRIISFHKPGGMGRVYRAHDADFDREVALKEIRPERAADPAARARFLFEAKVTGRLEHPGVVPVYGLGTHADGRPFYAMRFIHGESLEDAIKAFYAASARREPDRALRFRKLLGRFVDVCNAVAYAHSRGVLHRDLKPDNVMLGPYGETLVVDWGLAKSMGDSLGEAETIALTEIETPALSSSGGAGETRPGATLGTPAYMSPEQAAGRITELGPATDVYSLGATLYHLITGVRPFSSGNLIELLDGVKAGKFRRPRERNKTIDRSLEAVCLRAMELAPGDRYASPKELSDDVERWLADAPVSVLRESVSDHVARFGRRHRGAVRAGLAALVALAVFGMAAAVVFNNQRDAAEQLSQQNAALAGSMSALAAEKSSLAEEKSALADKERTARETADSVSGRLRLALTRSSFEHGLLEYDSGRTQAGYEELWRAATTCPPDSPLRDGFRAVFVDRLSHGGRQMLAPLRTELPGVGAEFSSDGRRILTLEYEPGPAVKTLRLWDAQTAEPLGPAIRHARLLGGTFTSDGKQIITWQAQGLIEVWDGLTLQPIGKGFRYNIAPSVVAVSPDGRLLFLASANNQITPYEALFGLGLGQIWSLDERKLQAKTPAHEGGISTAEFSPDGARLVTGGKDRVVRLCDARTGKTIGAPMRHDETASRAVFRPSGDLIATGSDDKTARLWDGRTAAPIGEPLRHPDRVRDVKFSPDGETLLTACDDGGVRRWDVRTGREIGELLEHRRGVSSVAYNPEGDKILTLASRLGGAASWLEMQLWDAETGKPLGPAYPQPVLSAGFSPDGATLVATHPDRTMRLWDARIGTRLTDPIQLGRPIKHLAFSPDGTRLAVATQFGRTQIWDAQTGQPVGAALSEVMEAEAFAFTRDGKQLATASVGGFRVWNSQTAEAITSPGVLFFDPLAIEFNRSGNLLAIVRDSDQQRGVTRLWDAKSLLPYGRVLKHSSMITKAKFNRNATLAVTMAGDRTARIWNAETGEPLGPPLPHEADVTDVGFSHDGRRVVTASEDGTVRVWDAQTQQVIDPPFHHDSLVHRAAFSPDDARLAVTLNGAGVRLRDARTGALLGPTTLGARDAVEVAQFSPDGRSLALGGPDGVVRLYDAFSGAPVILHADPTRRVEPTGPAAPAGDDAAFRLWAAVWGGIDAQASAESEVKRLTYAEWDAARERWQVEGKTFQAGRQAQRARDAVAWRRSAAERAEADGRWFAARFHFQQLLTLNPDDEALRSRLTTVEQRWQNEQAKKTPPAADANTTPAAP